MNFQGTGIYRHTKTHQLVFAYRGGSIIHILTIPGKNRYNEPHRIFQGSFFTLYLPAEGRSFKQMLTDYPELLI